MDTNKVHYEDGKKFQTTRDCVIQTSVFGYNIETDFCKLTTNGMLLVYKRFCWDGATGCLNTKSTIRGSLAHDVLYKLMRLELLPRSCQDDADMTLNKTLKKDGGFFSRALAWFVVLAFLGKRNTDPDNKKRELVAP